MRARSAGMAGVSSQSSPREAIEHGIGMVYQEMLCFPNLSVAGNIFAGREMCHSGMLDNHAMRARTVALLERLSLPIDPDTPAEQLSAAHRQLLQVARALAFECEILVLDEPTTALTDTEADHLFDVLRELKRGGTTLSTCRIACRKCSGYAIASRCCATASSWAPTTATPSRQTTSSAPWSDVISPSRSARSAAGTVARSAKADHSGLVDHALVAADRTSATSR